MGSPTKFHAFLKAMRKVLDDPATVTLTDRELLVLVNSKLRAKQRVSEKTFEAWKSPNRNHVRGLDANDSVSTIEAEEFRMLLDVARVGQKMALTKNILDNDNSYGSQWILERKFGDMKLNQQPQLSGGATLNITVGAADHRELIEGILNGHIIDVEHEDLSDQKELSEHRTDNE